MEQQNLENHTKSEPMYLIAAALWLVLVLAFIALGLNAFLGWDLFGESDTRVIWTLIGVPVVTLAFFAMLLFIIRPYATKLQDRIIKQEVQFRHYVMTNKLLDPRITIKQMIALRFAGDDEFLELCNKTAEQNLDPKTIKTMIKNWKGDFDRV